LVDTLTTRRPRLLALQDRILSHAPSSSTTLHEDRRNVGDLLLLVLSMLPFVLMLLLSWRCSLTFRGVQRAVGRQRLPLSRGAEVVHLGASNTWVICGQIGVVVVYRERQQVGGRPTTLSESAAGSGAALTIGSSVVLGHLPGSRPGKRKPPVSRDPIARTPVPAAAGQGLATLGSTGPVDVSLGGTASLSLSLPSLASPRVTGS